MTARSIVRVHRGPRFWRRYIIIWRLWSSCCFVSSLLSGLYLACFYVFNEAHVVHVLPYDRYCQLDVSLTFSLYFLRPICLYIDGLSLVNIEVLLIKIRKFTKCVFLFNCCAIGLPWPLLPIFGVRVLKCLQEPISPHPQKLIILLECKG